MMANMTDSTTPQSAETGAATVAQDWLSKYSRFAPSPVQTAAKDAEGTAAEVVVGQTFITTSSLSPSTASHLH